MEMTVSAPSVDSPGIAINRSTNNEANASGVSWSAVIAGGFVSAALALILLALGAGLGLSSVSFWSNQGASASALSKAAIIWLILMQIISSSMGGWLAGRLRTKWTSIHTDEVYFRDTAHGFLAWCVALVASAALLTTAATSMVGSSSQNPAGNAMGTQNESSAFGPNEYFVESLFRANGAKSDDTNDASARREAETILAIALQHGDLTSADKEYLAQMVGRNTGLPQSDAENRVTNVFANAKQAAETARKTVAHSLLWVFLALLIGAFCASFAATIGGRQRDHVMVV